MLSTAPFSEIFSLILIQILSYFSLLFPFSDFHLVAFLSLSLPSLLPSTPSIRHLSVSHRRIIYPLPFSNLLRLCVRPTVICPSFSLSPSLSSLRDFSSSRGLGREQRAHEREGISGERDVFVVVVVSRPASSSISGRSPSIFFVLLAED